MMTKLLNDDKTIEALNSLIGINNDRVEGYDNASENTGERDLIDLFSKFKSTSKRCRGELIREINKLDGEATTETSASGKFFRAWMDFKSALTGKDRRAILNSCEYGEENAIEVYNNVLEHKSEFLNLHLKEVIESQLIRLKADQRTINSMQNNLVETP